MSILVEKSITYLAIIPMICEIIFWAANWRLSRLQVVEALFPLFGYKYSLILAWWRQTYPLLRRPVYYASYFTLFLSLSNFFCKATVKAFDIVKSSISLWFFFLLLWRIFHINVMSIFLIIATGSPI